MLVENRCVVPADLLTTWNLVTDVPRVALCVPGVQEVNPVGDKRFQATMKVRVGPVSINLTGAMEAVSQDLQQREAKFKIEAADRRVGGSVKANLSVHLNEQNGATELVITTDATFMGKLGELGQPVIKHKAQSTMAEFARNLAKQVGAPSA